MKKILLILFFLISFCFQVEAINSTNPLCFEEDGQSCTSDNGRSALHPDVFFAPAGLCDFKAWFFYTKWPPNADEDLMLRRSNDWITWDADTNYTNPILTDTSHSWTFYADPDVLWIDEYEDILVFGSPNESDGDSIITLNVIDVDAAGCASIVVDDYGGTGVNGNTSPVLINGNDTGGRAGEVDAVSGDSAVSYPSAIFFAGPDRDTWTDDWIWLYYGEVTDELCSVGSTENTGWMFLAKFQYNPNDKSVNNFSRFTGDETGGAVAEFPTDNNNSGFDVMCGIGHMDIVRDPYDGEFRMLMLRQNETGKFSGGGFFVSRATSSDGEVWVEPAVDTDITIRCSNVSFDDDTTEDAAGCYRSVHLHDGQGHIVRMTATVATNSFKRLAIFGSYNGTFTEGEGYHFHLVDEGNKTSGASGFTAGFPRLRGGINLP